MMQLLHPAPVRKPVAIRRTAPRPPAQPRSGRRFLHLLSPGHQLTVNPVTAVLWLGAAVGTPAALLMWWDGAPGWVGVGGMAALLWMNVVLGAGAQWLHERWGGSELTRAPKRRAAPRMAPRSGTQEIGRHSAGRDLDRTAEPACSANPLHTAAPAALTVSEREELALYRAALAQLLRPPMHRN